MLQQTRSAHRDDFDQHEFIVQSNLIDAQYYLRGTFAPGDEPGTHMYENALAAFRLFEELNRADTLPLDLTHRFHFAILDDVHHLEERGLVGGYRDCEVTIGHYIKFPPKEMVQDLVERILIKPINAQGQLEGDQAREFAWRCHHIFECIHPYVDGNGRTGRVLLNFLLERYGVPKEIVFFDQRQEYYQQIQNFRHTEFAALLSEAGCSPELIRDLCSEEEQDKRLRKTREEFWLRLYLEEERQRNQE